MKNKLPDWARIALLIILFPSCCFFLMMGLGEVPEAWPLLYVLLYYPAMWGMAFLCGWGMKKIIKPNN